MVRYAAQQIQNLCPQVINAARILASRPRSKVAQENMDVFKVAWESQVQILTDAIDDIVTVDDFLAVSENHILEDVNRCCLALQEREGVTLDRVAGAIRVMSGRLSVVVTQERDNYESGVLRRGSWMLLSGMVTIWGHLSFSFFRLLKSDVMPNFSSHVENAVNALGVNKMVEEN